MIAAALLTISLQLPLALSDQDEAVVAGREALDQWWGYPWYDAQSDSVRPIELSEPPEYQTAPVTGNWLDFLVQWLAWLGIGAVLGALIYLMLWAWRERAGSRKSVDDQSPDTALDDRIDALPVPGRPGRLDWLAEARRHYQEGNYSQAILYLFSFQLVQLDRRQIIRLAKGKTNRQYLREVGSRRDLRRLVADSMVAFEEVFFGHRNLDRSRFEACWSRLDEFEAHLVADPHENRPPRFLARASGLSGVSHVPEGSEV